MTIKRVATFNLGNSSDKEDYETLINDPNLVYINKEEFTYSKKTDQPIITIWYEYMEV